MHFKYFIASIMYLALFHSGFECRQTLPMPLLDNKMQAALTANIDVTVLKDYITKEIQAAIETLKMNMEITAEKLNHSLETQSKELTSTVMYQLEENKKATQIKLEERIKQIELNLEQKAMAPRQGCQSGTTGEHAYPQVRFPTSQSVTFNPPFKEIPAVVYGLYLLDSNRNQNVRVRTDISSLSRNGFTLVISTFADTLMYGAYVSWMACPKTF